MSVQQTLLCFSNQFLLDCYTWYKLLLRMLGLMAAAVMVPLDLLELQAFHKWVISLWLEQCTPQQSQVFVSTRGTHSLICWNCKAFLMKKGSLKAMPLQRETVTMDTLTWLGSIVVPQGHRVHVDGMPVPPGVHRPIMTY